MSWAEGKLLALDTETSGINIEEVRIVSACAAIVTNGVVEYQKDWLVAVDVEIPKGASDVHGISTEHAREHGRPAGEVIPEIVNAIRYALTSHIPIVAYNGCFDLSLADREARRWMGQDLEAAVGLSIRPVLDPFVIWKAMERRKGKRQLTNACEAFGIDLGDNAHEAAADAIASVRVLMALAKKYPRITRMSLHELHDEQIEWRREQCDSLRSYFDSMNKAHDGVPVEWPILPFARESVPA